MEPVQLVFLILAAVLFGLAAFGVAASRVNLVAAGLLSWVLATLLPALLH
jgi:NADH:ubiquinone oxidoreductase subunit K